MRQETTPNKGQQTLGVPVERIISRRYDREKGTHGEHEHRAPLTTHQFLWHATFSNFYYPVKFPRGRLFKSSKEQSVDFNGRNVSVVLSSPGVCVCVLECSKKIPSLHPSIRESEWEGKRRNDYHESHPDN